MKLRKGIKGPEEDGIGRRKARRSVETSQTASAVGGDRPDRWSRWRQTGVGRRLQARTGRRRGQGSPMWGLVVGRRRGQVAVAGGFEKDRRCRGRCFEKDRRSVDRPSGRWRVEGGDRSQVGSRRRGQAAGGQAVTAAPSHSQGVSRSSWKRRTGESPGREDSLGGAAGERVGWRVRCQAGFETEEQAETVVGGDMRQAGQRQAETGGRTATGRDRRQDRQ